jgi:uncharacterized damage-inducible protein DinB
MVNNEQLYLITDISGFTPQISRLLSMMNYARHTTLNAVKELTTEELDFILDQQGNSIGGLLLHFAAVEYAYQVDTFEGRELDENEMTKWGSALKLGEEGRINIQGNDLSFYEDQLNEVRDKTFDLFKTVDDEWLNKEEAFWFNKPANNYFKWFHVFEDEINHRGQIRLIRKRLKLAASKR